MKGSGEKICRETWLASAKSYEAWSKQWRLKKNETLSKESKASDSKGVLILGTFGFFSFRAWAKPQNLGLTISQSSDHFESKDFGLDPTLMLLLYGSNILL